MEVDKSSLQVCNPSWLCLMQCSCPNDYACLSCVLYLFQATTAVGSADIFAIPAVDIPITPGQCMYDSFITASERLKLPKPLMESCVAETDYCGGVLCNLTLPGEVYESCITIEPCNQTLRIVITDSLNLQNTFERVFYNNESVVLYSSNFQIHLNVLLDHYNYSMEATVS